MTFIIDHCIIYKCSGDKIDKNEMDGECSTYVGKRNVYRVLVGKLREKSPLGRSRHRWEYNVKMDLQELGCGYMHQIDLAQDRGR